MAALRPSAREGYSRPRDWATTPAPGPAAAWGWGNSSCVCGPSAGGRSALRPPGSRPWGQAGHPAQPLPPASRFPFCWPRTRAPGWREVGNVPPAGGPATEPGRDGTGWLRGSGREARVLVMDQSQGRGTGLLRDMGPFTPGPNRDTYWRCLRVTGFLMGMGGGRGPRLWAGLGDCRAEAGALGGLGLRFAAGAGGGHKEASPPSSCCRTPCPRRRGLQPAPAHVLFVLL